MPSSFSCPHCNRRLRGIPVSGRIDMACAGCGYRFRMVNGRLVGDASSQARASKRGVAAEPSDSASSWAMMVGALTTGAIAFLMGYFDRGAGPALVSASLGGIASGVWLKWQMTAVVPVLYLTPDSRAAFATAEHLGSAKERLVASRSGHVAALTRTQGLRRRLMDLRKKMQEVALPAYGPRIASIDTALVMLDRQSEMSALLRAGYDKSIKMIDIELESGVAADQMNEDISATIAAAVSELRELEESQAELVRQLEANVEVEQLLRRAI